MVFSKRKIHCNLTYMFADYFLCLLYILYFITCENIVIYGCLTLLLSESLKMISAGIDTCRINIQILKFKDIYNNNSALV
jgi:hypothetical protein